jgi:hypothetical protein
MAETVRVEKFAVGQSVRRVEDPRLLRPTVWQAIRKAPAQGGSR